MKNNTKKYTFNDLRTIMAKLRDPDGGCPWDLVQDFKSIAPYTIEEAYEVDDAIARGSIEDLREELGDLLLQPVYHAQMASEDGLFDLDDVIHDIAAKMIRRHPHVFGDAYADTPADVNAIWNDKKSQEKSVKTRPSSALDGVPVAMPALLRAQKLQNKAAKTGFEWRDISGVLDKLQEEIVELKDAISTTEQGLHGNVEEEFGDILFVLVNFARMNNICAETTLRLTNDKFTRRFRGMEDDLKAEDKTMSDLSMNQMLALWAKQKAVKP